MRKFGAQNKMMKAPAPQWHISLSEVSGSLLWPHVLVGLEREDERVANRLPVGPRFAVGRRTQKPAVAPQDFVLFRFEVDGGRGHPG